MIKIILLSIINFSVYSHVFASCPSESAVKKALTALAETPFPQGTNKDLENPFEKPPQIELGYTLENQLWANLTLTEGKTMGQDTCIYTNDKGIQVLLISGVLKK